jgi:hypothetical protein
MKTRFLFGGLFLIASIVAIRCVNATAQSDNVNGKIILAQTEIKNGVWVYFSSSFFPGDNIMHNGEEQDLTRPYVEKKLSPEEVVLLDSVMKGFKNIPDSNMRATKGCFSPRHAVVFYSEGIPQDWINICFACEQAYAYPDRNLSKATLDAWEIFFTRIGFPARNNYQVFFDKAKTDSIYKKKTGTFHF